MSTEPVRDRRVDDPPRGLGMRGMGPVPRRSLPALFFGLGVAIMLAFVLWVAKGVLVPVVVAAFVSFLIVSVKQAITRVPRIGRFVPERLAFLLAFAVIVGLLVALGVVIAANVEQVIAEAPAYYVRFAEIIEDTLAWAQGAGLVEEDAGLVLDDVRDAAIGFTRSGLSSVAATAGGLVGGLVTILLYTAFILVERGRLLRKIAKIGGAEGSPETVSDVMDDISHLVREYISVKTLTSLMVAGISYVIMVILGVDFAAFFALLIFALNFIPIIGSIVAVTLPVMLALVQPGGGFVLAGVTLALLFAAEQAIGSVIEPRLLGKSLNLSPLVILLSLASWGTLWGFAGMLLCVPITVAIMIVLSQFEASRPIAVLLSDNGEVAPLKRGRTALEERRGAPLPV